MAANSQSTAANSGTGGNKGLDEKLMDDYLKANGLYRRRIAKDGSCLFRAVAEQFIEGDFEEYLQRLQHPQSWVGQVEISALAVIYKHDFIIYQNPGEPPANITENGFPDKVQLCFLNGNHYDSVYPASFVKNAAMCQSILYELLYERVYGMDRSALTNTKGPRARDEAAEAEVCKGSDESDQDEAEDVWSSEASGNMTTVNNRPSYKGRGRGQSRGCGRGSLPREVQCALNPGVFRNVPYDVWIQSKKDQQRRDFCMAAGMQYTAGDKCQVRLTNTGRFYGAYIQEVNSDNGPVTVFIKELGERHVVPLWNLRSPSEESWSTVTEKGKRHSMTNGNGHTNEWESRGGRKTARSVSNPYTSQTTGSHVQKQHSWPPQASEDNQSQGKNASSRKTDPDVGGLGMSPAEEEELLVLELLHKDENNFPSLEASAQAAAGESSKRAERKGSRKKVDTEPKEQSPRPDPKADSGKPGKKGGLLQDQRGSPPIKEKPNPASNPPSNNSPALKASKTTPDPPTTAPSVTAESTPCQTRTEPAAPSATSASAQTSAAVSRTTTVTASAPATVALTLQNKPTQAQTAPRAVSTVTMPVSSVLTPNTSRIVSVPSATHSEVSTTAAPASKSAPVPTAFPIIFQSAPLPLTKTSPKAGTTPLVAPSTLPTGAHSQTAPVVTPVQSQTAPVPSTAHSQPAPAPSPSHSQPAPAPIPTHPIHAPAPIPAHTQPAPAPIPAHPQPAPAPIPAHPQPAPAPSPSHHQTTSGPQPTPIPSQTAPANTPALAPTPNPSQVTPALSVPEPEVPVHPAELPGASSTPPAHAPHSMAPPAPVSISTAPAQGGGSVHQIGFGTFPMMPQFTPYMNPSPTSVPILTPTAAMSSAMTLPYSHPQEPRPFEPAASPVTGVGPATGPDCLSHVVPHPQHPFSLATLPHLSQDLLYPGYPQNEQDEPVQPPHMSQHPGGKDLPKDTSVLRWFFNLGVKAYTHQMYPPYTYLVPLTHAYHIQRQVPLPAPSSSPYPPQWQPDNVSPMLHVGSAPGHSHIGPVGHFDVRGVVPGPPPVEAGGYPGPSRSLPMHMPMPVSPSPNLYAGVYSVPTAGQYSAAPRPPQSGQAYPSPPVGHQHPPFPPPQRPEMDMTLVAMAPAMERGDGDGQRSLTPQAAKGPTLGRGQPLPGGGNINPMAVPVAVETQQTSEVAEVSSVKAEDNAPLSFGVGLISHVQATSPINVWDLEEAEYGEADLRSGRSYHSRSMKTGGRRGQDDRGGGFRGRSFRAWRDHGGRGRAAYTQSYLNRGYVRGRGRSYIPHSGGREVGYSGGPFAPPPNT
ncbi:OTU domain-containing protein 4 isoform X2 [Hoplias malabaricus]|uniref:OTU domain-containing protein 4 isoform X2 n=1 Tax=Hoplias malabaricus TaxID=27720 RepID=UPI00346377E5